jgi:hypothetical protein
VKYWNIFESAKRKTNLQKHLKVFGKNSTQTPITSASTRTWPLSVHIKDFCSCSTFSFLSLYQLAMAKPIQTVIKREIDYEQTQRLY